MIKIIEGNIVNAKTDFIIHQVNCQGEMNTGVAKALRDYDEGIYKHYRKFCEFCKFESEELLGTCDAYLLKDRGQIVLSLFAQNKYGYDGKQYKDKKSIHVTILMMIILLKKMFRSLDLRKELILKRFLNGKISNEI